MHIDINETSGICVKYKYIYKYRYIYMQNNMQRERIKK